MITYTSVVPRWWWLPRWFMRFKWGRITIKSTDGVLQRRLWNHALTEDEMRVEMSGAEDNEEVESATVNPTAAHAAFEWLRQYALDHPQETHATIALFAWKEAADRSKK